MKMVLPIFVIVAVALLTVSCQKDLPDSMSDVVVSKGYFIPVDQGEIPTEDDNPMPIVNNEKGNKND